MKVLRYKTDNAKVMQEFWAWLNEAKADIEEQQLKIHRLLIYNTITWWEEVED